MTSLRLSHCSAVSEARHDRPRSQPRGQRASRYSGFQKLDFVYAHALNLGTTAALGLRIFQKLNFVNISRKSNPLAFGKAAICPNLMVSSSSRSVEIWYRIKELFQHLCRLCFCEISIMLHVAIVKHYGGPPENI